jgi:protein involved in polysaccharide export with SLBB domain
MPLTRRIASVVVPLCCFALLATGCAGPFTQKKALPTVEPPREQVRAAQAREPIKIFDVLQLRLPDEPTASINGIYQVAADGSIQLSSEGRVQVGGKTLDEARQAVRNALAISYAVQTIDLLPYEFYMVRVVDGAARKVVRVPLKDNITVKDALKGSPPLANKRIWIARPNPDKPGQDQVLTVDWKGITHGDKSATDYPMRAGDYLFVADPAAGGLGRLSEALNALVTPVDGSTAATADQKPPKPAS